MKLLWTAKAWEEYLHWQKTDAKTLQAVNNLIKEIRRSHLRGSENRNPSRHLCTDGGRDAYRVSTDWSTGFPAKTIRSRSKSRSAAAIIEMQFGRLWLGSNQQPAA